MKPSEVFLRSLDIRNNLIKEADNKDNPIDDRLLPVLPYRISNKVSLIFIGQDPTVKNSNSRQFIEYALNLDKNGSLKTYIMKICAGLDISFENIYATNIFKYFYTNPPSRTIHVLHAHLEENLKLLKQELSVYPRAKIITFGEPVLKLLAGDDAYVKDFWGYQKKNKTSGNFKRCEAKDNKLERVLYPFPHQPSLGKEFYANTLDDYINFVRSDRK
jgi:uracil-DNA glycosylase